MIFSCGLLRRGEVALMRYCFILHPCSVKLIQCVSYFINCLQNIYYDILTIQKICRVQSISNLCFLIQIVFLSWICILPRLKCSMQYFKSLSIVDFTTDENTLKCSLLSPMIRAWCDIISIGTKCDPSNQVATRSGAVHEN